MSERKHVASFLLSRTAGWHSEGHYCIIKVQFGNVKHTCIYYMRGSKDALIGLPRGLGTHI